jgi:YD repeat-containing protein
LADRNRARYSFGTAALEADMTPPEAVQTLADWNLRGPVHTVRVEQATWDAEGQSWKPARQFTTVTFRTDGRAAEVLTHNPDGSTAYEAWVYDDSGRLLEKRNRMNDDTPVRVTYDYDAGGRVVLALQVTPDGSRSEIERSTYDEAGRRTKISVLPKLPSDFGDSSVSYGVEGSRTSYGAPGATALATDYDERGLPAMGTFRDAEGRVVLRVTFTRDDEGRLLTEEARMGGPSFLANVPPDQDLPDEARAQVAAFAGVAFPDDVFSAASQRYDAAGRLIERTSRFGPMFEERTTYEYGDHEEATMETLVEETSAGWSRSMNSDDGGAVVQAEKETSVSQSRFEHQYDAQGNWTERIIACRSGMNGPFRPSQIERRVITYHDR